MPLALGGWEGAGPLGKPCIREPGDLPARRRRGGRGVPRPDGVAEEAWLTCFPSFGFLLAVDPRQSPGLRERLALCPELLAAPIGRFGAGAARVALRRGDDRASLWEGDAPLTGF